MTAKLITSIFVAVASTCSAALATSISISTNSGYVTEVSDLSKGGLRLGGSGQLGQPSEVVSEQFNVEREAYIAFDWRVTDTTLEDAYSYYDINIFSGDNNGVKSLGAETFQDGEGVGVYCGTVSHLLGEGAYTLDIGVFVYDTQDSYLLDVSNVRLSDVDVGVDGYRCNVPDSPLGFAGTLSILSLIGLRRRLGRSAKS
jgi:hypothetical protein